MKRTLLIALLFAPFACGQATMNSTTLAAAIPDPTTANSGGYVLYLASCANVLAPGLAQAQGGIGNSLGANYYLLLIDSEFFRVLAVNSNATPCQVTYERGVQGSATAAHALGATVYTAPASLFSYTVPYQGQQDHTIDGPGYGDLGTGKRAPFFKRVGSAVKRAWKAVF